MQQSILFVSLSAEFLNTKLDMKYYLLLLLTVLMVFPQMADAQKKVKPLRTQEQLKEAKVYRSWSEAMANKKRVYILNLDNKKLTKIPSKIGKLKNLQQLYIRNNQISSLPDALFQLQNLQVIALGENKLTEIPVAITHFQSLRYCLSPFLIQIFYHH